MRGWRRLAQRMFASAMDLNIQNIARARKGARVLDLGCWDGEVTTSYVPPRATVFGVEISADATKRARARGIRVLSCDLNRPLPLRSESVDAVTSNQVIEHLYNTDNFLRESYRVLRPGGTLVVSTENLASWHNIFSLLFGWQAFSLTNVSYKRPGIGNPLANLVEGDIHDAGWEHLRIFSYRGLKELCEHHGFSAVSIVGAGYYPLPARVGRFEPRHAAFITAIASKPA